MEKAGQGDPTRGLLQTKAKKQGQAQLEELYSQIGRLKVENEWLRKTAVRTLEEKRQMIGWEHPQLTVQRQCELLELARSSLYYRPVGEREYNLELMRIIDRVYTDRPILGVRRYDRDAAQDGTCRKSQADLSIDAANANTGDISEKAAQTIPHPRTSTRIC